MKLSISTFKLICSLWNYPEEILEDKDYLQQTIKHIDKKTICLTEQEQTIAKEEIKQLIETL